MLISPFTPLFWEIPASDGIPSRYTQVFAATDTILLEFIGEADPPVVYPVSLDGANLQALELNSWEMADGLWLHFAEMRGLSDGSYQIYSPTLQARSQTFRVTSDPAELANTVLLQYSMKDNRDRRDGVFLIAGMRKFFDFRVPGGFKASGWTFTVESEQFTTPQADIVSLYALDSVSKKLTIGSQIGVPIWFGEMLNRALCCHYFYVDGTRYSRKDATAPEIAQPQEGLDSFILTQQLQKVANLNPAIENNNLAAMRRVGLDADDYRTTAHNNTEYNRLTI
ncbi:MAG: hypothetical protein LIO91_08035 [Bacteroidales bacterium]|nr:hypothetical protein [Bacteroidales bacterium]